MSWNTGPGGFTTGTGNEDIDLGMSNIKTIWLEHGSSSTKHASGVVVTSGPSYYCYVTDSSNSVNKALEIQNTAGTVVFSATYVSNPSGTNYRFNKTVNTLGTVNVLFTFTNT